VRILVTGITGFVGRALSPRLAADAHEVLGLAYDGPNSRAEGGRVQIRQLDLAEGRGLVELLQSFRPEAVIHLAAQSSPGLSLADPVGTFRANVNGTLSLLEGLRRTESTPRFIFISSSEVYGLSAAPLDESAPLAPVNPYGASKAAAEFLVAQYARSLRFPLLIVRPFPHGGPGQRPLFALPSFARQIARIEAGRQEPSLKVGNLDARRDWLDVSDVAEVYARLLTRGVPGEIYNLCSGETHSVREGLVRFLTLATREIEIVTDPDLLRPIDQPVLAGVNAKIRQATGWSPQVPFLEMLARILADWRRRVLEEESA
jgi:GDP-4-dehydro-6-deoxy-D-mannose reductase